MFPYVIEDFWFNYIKVLQCNGSLNRVIPKSMNLDLDLRMSESKQSKWLRQWKHTRVTVTWCSVNWVGLKITFFYISRAFQTCFIWQELFFLLGETCGVLLLRLRPITIIMEQSRNLFILAPPLPPKMMSVCRSNAGSLLPTGSTMISIGNWVVEASLVRQN